MSDLRQLGDTDRLPWLEPYREQTGERARAAVIDPKPAERRAVSVPLWLIALLGAAALALAGYVIGRRSSAPDTGASVTTELPAATLPYHSLDELANEEAPPPPPSLREVERNIAPSPVREVRAKRIAPKPSQRVKPRSAQPVEKQEDAPSAPQAPARSKPAEPARPRFVLRTSPPPAAGLPGQVIEIGRYTNPRIADAMWQRVIWRYPYLGRLNKAVTPTTAQRQRVYALRLGTGSRSNARTLCRNLVSIGYPCAVV